VCVLGGQRDCVRVCTHSFSQVAERIDFRASVASVKKSKKVIPGYRVVCEHLVCKGGATGGAREAGVCEVCAVCAREGVGVWVL
jgi:hypothetical protein